jgi:hypothetical protein
MTFSDRIRNRVRLWWGDASRRGPPSLHALRERYSLRHRDDPDDAWRCCPLWQRTLVNKWNSREFVGKHGGTLPQLYWCARMPSRRRMQTLPSHFVLRPVLGTNEQGVHVVANGRDLLRDEPFSVAALYRNILRAGRLAWTRPILAEEFVRSADGEYRLPVEYKCHTFAGTVAAVQVIEQSDVAGPRTRFYTSDWDVFPDHMSTILPEGERQEPPRHLADMLGLAVRLGTELETYMRIDFFETDRGWVFNEFASTPSRGEFFTPYCDDLFGQLWTKKCPSAT